MKLPRKGTDLQRGIAQLELPLEASTSFFYFYSSIIEDGHLAVMGPEAIAVLSVLRLRCDWKTSTVEIGIRQVCSLTGMSPRRVLRALDKLDEQGYIEKVYYEERKRGIYKIKDKIIFKDASGTEVMDLEIEYKPPMLGKQLAKLKELKKGSSVVPTQSEGINVFFVINDNSVTTNTQNVFQLNVGSEAIELAAKGGTKLPSKKILEALTRMMQAQIEIESGEE